jgi:hypothetical protein
MAVVRNDFYIRGQGTGINDRATLTLRPLAMVDGFKNVYVKGGVDGIKAVNGFQYQWMYGAGLSFDDEDIKLLFSLR